MNLEVSKWILREFEDFVCENSRKLPENIVQEMRKSFIFHSNELADDYVLTAIHLGQWFGRIETRRDTL